jgi:hypothetical protein
MIKSVFVITLQLFVGIVYGQSSDIVEIDFTSSTRGYQMQVWITPDSLIQSVAGRQDTSVARKLDRSSWDELIRSISDLDLEKIPSLERPSTRSAFDGARESTLKIIDSKGHIWRHSFDDQNPNSELKLLMDGIGRLLNELTTAK